MVVKCAGQRVPKVLSPNGNGALERRHNLEVGPTTQAVPKWRSHAAHCGRVDYKSVDNAPAHAAANPVFRVYMNCRCQYHRRCSCSWATRWMHGD